MINHEIPPYHLDSRQFRDAIGYTEANRHFRALLIEKDYYCSLVLRDLTACRMIERMAELLEQWLQVNQVSSHGVVKATHDLLKTFNATGGDGS